MEAVRKLSPGKVLKGGVGSGKSRTSLAYYFFNIAQGRLKVNGKGEVKPFKNPIDLLIITTAKKRNDLDWNQEAATFGLSTNRENSFGNVKVTIDSWQNIKKYENSKDIFIIFDEQRLTGRGAWVRSFLKMAKNNLWILLSATPGDNWMDYVPVFIANGYYKNRTEFENRHVLYNKYAKYPKIDDYRGLSHLKTLRSNVIVDMPYKSHTKRLIRTVTVGHDKDLYDRIVKDRWNYIKEMPIRNVSELFALMRRVVNTDNSRIDKLLELYLIHPKMIVFYNFDYELFLLRKLAERENIIYAEHNGHLHQPVPKGNSWMYFVQYNSGAEAWNCITTDTMVFYSLNYSYRMFEQSQGRIDRRNTPYTDLNYYVFRSNSWIDSSIWKALVVKKNFNESVYKDKIIFEKG